ncbi:MAG: hypothetical protein IPM99_25140 [Rubrivivax sp.]|jgi:hypothetical protein|nr:hypothetical protein [Rubrivivax sp.]
MVSILRPFAVIAQAIKAFFRADVRVRRGERGLEVVLDEAQPKRDRAGRRGPSQPGAAALKEQQESQRMQASLARLLDGLPANRAALRQLALIEHALAKKGLRGLTKVPYDVLRQALDQFEGLVTNWSDDGLALLRSKMAVMLIEREPEARATPAPAASPARPPVEDVETGALAHPVTLEGDDAAEAEAALLAAYGDVMLPGLDLGGAGDEAPGAAVELQGELQSPSAKAIARAARRGDEVTSPARRQELPA